MLRILQERLTHDIYGAREGFGDIFLLKQGKPTPKFWRPVILLATRSLSSFSWTTPSITAGGFYFVLNVDLLSKVSICDALSFCFYKGAFCQNRKLLALSGLQYNLFSVP